MSACHGFAGNSRGATVPILAGMAPGYLGKALQDYASGKRLSTEMEPYAKMAVQLGIDEIAGSSRRTGPARRIVGTFATQDTFREDHRLRGRESGNAADHGLRPLHPEPHLHLAQHRDRGRQMVAGA